ncbi:MAG: iron-containing alcohol dehydrogenase family protein [bacterium]|nr:iron-containing alcohol dehydrogenase family protein [bacterium]
MGEGSMEQLPSMISARKQQTPGPAIFFIDQFFKSRPDILGKLGVEPGDETLFVDATNEPSTDTIDAIVTGLRSRGLGKPSVIVGMGGGSTMDTAKAVANLLTNGGKAEDYQGWDLVKVPGIYKIAVPTISGTGAEATRTCVMINKRTGLKLGMNSDFTVYDQIIMDPFLAVTVPRNQYFYTGMDAYIHCIEVLAGSYRNVIGDAFSRETINLCRQVFLEGDMMNQENIKRLMVASYLGGSAIATSYVGVVHPFSAGLSVVLGLHHCVANCIAMRAMQPYYPKEFDEFWSMVERQGVKIPEGVCRDLTDEQYEALYNATVIHEKPLTNALGEDFRRVLSKEEVTEIFKRM